MVYSVLLSEIVLFKHFVQVDIIIKHLSINIHNFSIFNIYFGLQKIILRDTVELYVTL